MKKLIQKLQQKLDITPEGKYKEGIKKQILELKLSKDNKLSLTTKTNTMFNKPTEAIIIVNKKGNVTSVITPYDNDETLKNPIESLGNENKNILKDMFVAIGEAWGFKA